MLHWKNMNPNISVSYPFLPRLKTNPGLSPKNFFDASKSWNSDRSHMSRTNLKEPSTSLFTYFTCPRQIGLCPNLRRSSHISISFPSQPDHRCHDLSCSSSESWVNAFYSYLHSGSAWCDILPLSCFRISAINAAWKSWHKDTYVGKVHVTRKHGPRTETLYKTDYSLARWLLCLKWRVKTISKKNAGLWPHWFCKLKTFGPATHRLSMAETFVFDKPIRHQYFVIHGANT